MPQVPVPHNLSFSAKIPVDGLCASRAHEVVLFRGVRHEVTWYSVSHQVTSESADRRHCSRLPLMEFQGYQLRTRLLILSFLEDLVEAVLALP